MKLKIDVDNTLIISEWQRFCLVIVEKITSCQSRCHKSNQSGCSEVCILATCIWSKVSTSLIYKLCYICKLQVIMSLSASSMLKMWGLLSLWVKINRITWLCNDPNVPKTCTCTTIQTVRTMSFCSVTLCNTVN